MLRPVVLQSRDLDLLRGLFESRVMTGVQIAAIYFDDHAEMAKKRLQKLASSGLIARHGDTLLRPAPFVLATKGLALLRNRGILREYPPCGSSLDRRSRVSTRTLAHELEVIDVKAAVIRAARITDTRILEFTTWPLLNEFPDRNGQIVRPDGFIRIEEVRPDGSTCEHAFFVELDRSTETQGALLDRARSYFAFYRSGGFAVRSGGVRENFREFPFRVLYVLKTAERRNNTIERLLQQTPPILGLVWLTTFAEITANPFGRIWMTPGDYRAALGNVPPSRPVRWEYKRNTSRDKLVEQAVPRRTLLGT